MLQLTLHKICSGKDVVKNARINQVMIKWEEALVWLLCCIGKAGPIGSRRCVMERYPMNKWRISPLPTLATVFSIPPQDATKFRSKWDVSPPPPSRIWRDHVHHHSPNNSAFTFCFQKCSDYDLSHVWTRITELLTNAVVFRSLVHLGPQLSGHLGNWSDVNSSVSEQDYISWLAVQLLFI
jgi:hypothetical protein